MEERLYTWAVHMENKKTGEKQIQKVKADDAINAHSKCFFYKSEWTWTGTEPWHNVENKVEHVSGPYYRNKEKGENEPTAFEYFGYHFVPDRKLRECEKDSKATFLKHIRSDTTLGMCAYTADWKRHDYSWTGFYEASANSPLDLFRCVENGKLYVPSNCELYEFIEIVL